MRVEDRVLAADVTNPAGVETSRAGYAGTDMRVLPLSDALERFSDALNDLAQRAACPNPFYEPDALRSSIGMSPALAKASAWIVMDGEDLIGFLPVTRQRLHPRFPLHADRSLGHLYCFDTSPLVDIGRIDDAVAGLLGRLRQAPFSGLDLQGLDDDGPIMRSVQRQAERHGLFVHPHNRRQRAAIRRGENADAYISAALAKKRRKELSRQLRRLGDLGALEFRALDPGDDVEPWIERFVDLEASGWKGRDGTAIGCDPAHKRYFADLVRRRHALGLCRFLGLFIDERPIALKVNLMGRSDPGFAFAFKIAYDEALEKYSPGVQLELEQIRRLHAAGSTVAAMDSCAREEHFMINRLWTERRVLTDLVIATRYSPIAWAINAAQAGRRLRKLRPTSMNEDT